MTSSNRPWLLSRSAQLGHRLSTERGILIPGTSAAGVALQTVGTSRSESRGHSPGESRNESWTIHELINMALCAKCEADT